MGKVKIPCPVSECQKECWSYDGLFAHLYHDHRKADLIRALFKALGYPAYPHHRLPNGKLIRA